MQGSGFRVQGSGFRVRTCTPTERFAPLPDGTVHTADVSETHPVWEQSCALMRATTWLRVEGLRVQGLGFRV